MLWHIVLLFCIWLCFTVLQIKFECRQFASVFYNFLLHALTYWAVILHMTLFYCTTDQVRVSSIRVNWCGSYAPLELRILEIHSFPHGSLTCFDILSCYFVSLFYCTSDQVRVSSIYVIFFLCGSYASFGILKIYSFPHFSLTCFNILS